MDARYTQQAVTSVRQTWRFYPARGIIMVSVAIALAVTGVMQFNHPSVAADSTSFSSSGAGQSSSSSLTNGPAASSSGQNTKKTTSGPSSQLEPPIEKRQVIKSREPIQPRP